jgi:biliverdin reductase
MFLGSYYFHSRHFEELMTQPLPLLERITVGIVGTGYAAQRRVEALQADPRSHLRFITGYRPVKTSEVAQQYCLTPLEDWQALVTHPDIDLVIICTINADHGTIAEAALTAGKHVVVEYPLALSVQIGQKLLDIAQHQNKLLHVEHIELLGGLHQTLKRYLSNLGSLYYGRYSTLQPQYPAPQRWTYHREQFGFPWIAALSRIHRFTDALGTFQCVQGSVRYWSEPHSPYFSSCLCHGRLFGAEGLSVDLVYGKGAMIWQSDRRLELHGEKGSLVFEGDEGLLITANGKQTLAIPNRKGLFAKDTQMVLDYLFKNEPLYVSPQASLYALKVAAALQQADATKSIVAIA